MLMGMDGDSDLEDDDDHTNWREPTMFEHSENRTNDLEYSNITRLNFNSNIADDPPFSMPRHLNSKDTVCTNGTKKAPFPKDESICHHRCIIHIDFDCFYCQVEAIRNPALQNKPFGVYQKHIVVSSNYVARRLGVKKMSTRAEALKVCPDMIMVNGEDLTVYREFSMRMFDILKTISPVVERVGFDENFVDVTRKIDEMTLTPDEDHIFSGHCFGYTGKTDMSLNQILRMENANACQCGCFRRLALTSALAAKIRKLLHTELGLTSSAGIAHGKVLAKLIGKTHKPNQQTTILPTYAEEFLTCKNVREIPGIGSHCSKELNKMGIETVGMLGAVQRDKLVEKFGTKLGIFLSQISVGNDNTVVNISSDVPKSISEEESFRKLTNFEDVVKQMKLLITKLIKRIEKDGRAPRTIKLSVRKHSTESNFARVSRQANFDPRTLNSGDKESVGNAILENVVSLFDKMIDDRNSFDLAVINIAFTNFDEINAANIASFFVKESIKSKAKANASNIKNMEARKLTVNCSSNTLSCISSSKSSACSMENNTDERDDDVIKCKKDLNTPGCPSSLKVMNETQASTSVENHSQNPKDPSSRHSFLHKQNSTLRFNALEGQQCMDANNTKRQVSEFKSKDAIASDQGDVLHQCGSHMDSGLRVKLCSLENCSESFQNVAVGKNDEALSCPDGVDSSVYRALPVDIQNELMQNWKRKEHDVLSISNKGSTPKKKQKRNFTDAKSKNILHYFAK